MARPKKVNADYFSHDANASERKTVSIIENHFGVEGYAAWFKLLEQLTGAIGHYLKVESTEDIEFLSQKLKLLPQKLLPILNKLSELGAIDSNLYAQGYIWCPNLIERLKPVYEKRGESPPPPPLYNSKVKETRFLVSETGLSVPETTLPTWDYSNLLPPGYGIRPPFPFKNAKGEFDFMAVDKEGKHIPLPPLPPKDREYIPVIMLTSRSAPKGERYADLMLDVSPSLFFRAYAEGFIRETDEYIRGETTDETEFYYFHDSIPAYIREAISP